MDRFLSHLAPLLFTLATATSPATAAGLPLPVHAASDKPFRFVVLGDLHYKRPQFATRTVVANIAASVKDCQPPVAFVCQTGDIAEGGTYDLVAGKRVFRQATPQEMREELAFAVQDVKQQFGLPLFMAVGNHDKHAGGQPYAEVVPPVLSRELGTPVDPGCYAFRHGNACFLFLDFSAADFDQQRRQAGELLASARSAGVRHLFFFAHYPLWPLVRPGFSNQRFTDSVLPLFQEFPVDAWFCGHTHNTSAWVRHLPGSVIAQIQGVSCQSSPTLDPMEEQRTLLLPQSELPYYWGYLSGPRDGFYLVTVDGPEVHVQLRSGPTILREFAWQEPGQIIDRKRPDPRPRIVVSEEDLKQATAATLVLCPWAEDRVQIQVRLNGEPAGTAPLGPTMRSNAFVTETRIPIPPECLRRLRIDNEVTLESPERAPFAIGHVRLEVRLPSGLVARSSISDRFYFPDAASSGAPARNGHGWKIIPPEVRKEASPGQPLGPVRLRFPSRG